MQQISETTLGILQYTMPKSVSSITLALLLWKLTQFDHIDCKNSNTHIKNKAIFLNCQVFQREIYFYFLEDACITCNHAWHITWCICQTYTKGNWVWFCVNRLWGKLLLNITWLVAVQCVSRAGKVIKTNLRLVNRPCVECTVDGYSK